jgi:hypothetical protein
VRFRVTSIKWLSDEGVEVEGGYDDAWSASWTRFTLGKENGKWRVLKAELKRAFVV